MCFRNNIRPPFLFDESFEANVVLNNKLQFRRGFSSLYHLACMLKGRAEKGVRDGRSSVADVLMKEYIYYIIIYINTLYSFAFRQTLVNFRQCFRAHPPQVAQPGQNQPWGTGRTLETGSLAVMIDRLLPNNEEL